MRIIPVTGRYVALSLVCAFLAGCPATTATRLPPSVDRAAALAQRGDHLASAREYEALAADNPGTAGAGFQLQAAREYLDAGRPDDAQRLLDTLPVLPQAGNLTLTATLIRAELALARSQAPAAWALVGNLPEPADATLASQLLEVRQRAALANGRAVDAIRAEVARERLMPNDSARLDSRRRLLSQLRAAVERGSKLDPATAREPAIRGWLELGLIAAQASRGNAELPLASWRTRYPTHPAFELVRNGLPASDPATAGGANTPASNSGSTGGSSGTPLAAAAHVAVLLPMTGRTAAAAAQIRDGLMTALYALPAASRPSLRIYDTSTQSVPDAIARAAESGAEWIIGPLTRDEVVAAAEYTGRRPPLLALNFLPVEKPVPADFYQYALSPEDEARQVARRALADGRRRAVALVPAGDWGTRVANAFREELEAGGGKLLATAPYATGRNDYSAPIQQALRLADSSARARRIEGVLGSSLQFQPRRRGDVDFIFTPAPSATARQLRPQLRFQFAGDIPAYSTSDAYEPNPQANQDIDGLTFPDMPWVLGGNAAVSRVRTAAQNAWGDDAPRSKLYAFGYDAWQLASAIRGGAINSSFSLAGLTGTLSFDEQRRARRELNWAQIRGGNARLLSRDDGKN